MSALTILLFASKTHSATAHRLAYCSSDHCVFPLAAFELLAAEAIGQVLV